MAKTDWWFKFEFLKWLTDEQLLQCSLETQGFWIRCLCMMHKSGTAKLEGTAAVLCRLLSVTPTEFKRCFAELSLTKTATVTQTAQNFTLMSRKINKELKVKEQNRLRKQRERRHAVVTDVSQDKVKSKSNKKEVREEKKEELRDAPADAKTKKGARIPEPFLLTPEMRNWAAEKAPRIDIITETENFVDYWRSTPGQRGTKLDWVATWRTWMRRAKPNGANGNGSYTNGKKSNVDIAKQWADRLAALEDE